MKDQILQDHWEREYYLSPEDIEKSYKAVRRRIDGAEKAKYVRSARSLWLGVASAAAVAVLVTFFAFLPEREESITLIEDRYAEMTECYVGNGEKQMITLDDSTSVILNSGSLLIYPKEFQGPKREVYLAGEAIFDVSKDSQHPFIVKTEIQVEAKYFKSDWVFRVVNVFYSL